MESQFLLKTLIRLRAEAEQFDPEVTSRGAARHDRMRQLKRLEVLADKRSVRRLEALAKERKDL
jgi:hypothetical protein